MRVLKIIQANPEIFDVDQDINYAEIDAIRKIASMECKGNKIQKQGFEIRQTHIAICNLMTLGYVEAAMELTIKLIPKAELTQQYKIAQDLCDILITHFYQIDDLDSVKIYKTLYDKFSSNISFEHESMLLCAKAIHSHRKITPPINLNEVKILLGAIKKKLPFDSLWYYYYYYQFKSIILKGEDLEKLYHEAIAYFKDLHFNHKSFTIIFSERLIMYYLKNNYFEKAEKYLKLLDVGSISWFKSYLLYANELLKLNDIKSNDICILAMNHPIFIDLPMNLKKEWRIVYKASIRLLLER